MTYRSIMVQLDIDQPARPRVRFAWDLARRFEADLIGFVACQPQRIMAAGDGAMVENAIMQRQIEEIENRFREMREEFVAETGDDQRASWRGTVGEPLAAILADARAADLIVAPGPSHEILPNTHRTVDPGELILGAGRPVLFANSRLVPLHAERAVVAWKDTREARRAVADAMPFLAAAKEVLVVTADEGGSRAARETLADLVRYLMKHGVRARSHVLFPPDGLIGETISSTAFELGADLVVSGGYGHSRLREWAFGGVTRTLLADGSLCRLFSN